MATQSYTIKKVIAEYLNKSGDISGIDFKLHDFGARGVSSIESAGIGGAGHLINFMGTDTISGILYAMQYYDADVCGYSIPAMEHSTVTSWGRENEAKAYSNMVAQYGKPGSILAVVSDSFDIYEASKMWGTELKQQVVDSGATVVIRPDSGDPVEVLPKVVGILNTGFGHTKNSKGYKVLNNVRVIWGDGINIQSIKAIMRIMVDLNGWSADNFAFGMGGALLQIVDRDTQRFAMKCSSVQVDGEWRDVVKDPITDSGKRSKGGRVKLFTNSGGEYASGVSAPTGWSDKGIGGWTDALVTVYEDGAITKSYTFDEVRANSRK